MSADDDYYGDDDSDDVGGEQGAAAGSGSVEQPSLQRWVVKYRGWLLIAGLTVVINLFAIVMMLLRTGGRKVSEISAREIQALAVDMLGHEVGVNQIYQLLPMRGGKRMTVGMDVVLVLGQLPEERVEGALRPTPEEFELFLAAVRDMEPRIRSWANGLLQRLPPEEYGSVEALETIKSELRDYVNDSLEGFNFGKGLRKGIGKRRVTEVLLPMFVRQML